MAGFARCLAHFTRNRFADNFRQNSDQSKYRVWDYPVKEQYTHILKMIEESGPVETPQLGYSKVEAAFEGEFAFIHDAAEVR